MEIRYKIIRAEAKVMKKIIKDNNLFILKELLIMEENFPLNEKTENSITSIKTMTDIDIIFVFDNYIFLTEFKEIKPTFKHFQRLDNLFLSYSSKIQAISMWISLNFQEFKEKYNVKLESQKKYKLIPLIVTNHPITISTDTMILTVDSFKNFLYKLKKGMIYDLVLSGNFDMNSPKIKFKIFESN